MITTTVSGAVAPASIAARTLRPANLLAQQITGRPYLTFAQVALIRACPRKFAFQHVEHARREFLPSSLLFGGSIRSALELYFLCCRAKLGVTPEALLSAYHDGGNRQRREAGNVPVRFNKNEDADMLHALADRIMGAFLASDLAHPQGAIWGVEQEFRLVLDENLPDVLVRADLITQTDAAIHLVNWKTSRSRWSPQKAQDAGGPLILCGAMIQSLSSGLGLPVKLHLGVMTKAKAPRVQLLPVAGDVEHVAAAKESVAQAWTAIRYGSFYANPAPQNCTACPFGARCPESAQA